MVINYIAQKSDDLKYFRYTSFYLIWGLVDSQVPAEAYGRVTVSFQGRLELSNNTIINPPPSETNFTCTHTPVIINWLGTDALLQK